MEKINELIDEMERYGVIEDLVLDDIQFDDFD